MSLDSHFEFEHDFDLDFDFDLAQPSLRRPSLLLLAIKTLSSATKISFLTATNRDEWIEFLVPPKTLPFDGDAKQNFAAHSPFSSP